MAPSKDRAAALGFRCVMDAEFVLDEMSATFL